MTNKSKVDEMGEGDCSIQCWICPFCFDDHGYDKTDCKPANLILTIGDLRAELQTLKSAILAEKQDVARRAIEMAREDVDDGHTCGIGCTCKPLSAYNMEQILEKLNLLDKEQKE